MANWISWNDDNTNKGVEGRYCIIDNILFNYAEPTNCGRDWLTDFNAFPKEFHGEKCHRGYVPYAEWLNNYLQGIIAENSGITKVVNIGYSMGGGIAVMEKCALLDDLSDSIEGFESTAYSFGGPMTCEKTQADVLYRSSGDLVSIVPQWWYAEPIETKTIEAKWSPVWVSHLKYDIDAYIQEIMQLEVYGVVSTDVSL